MKSILIILFSSISLSLFGQILSIPKGGSVDTVYNKKDLPVKIKILDENGMKYAFIKLTYYENDTLKTYFHKTGKGQKLTTEYNRLGLAQISQTRYRDDISQTVFSYQYDSLDQVTRIWAVRNNKQLVISEGYKYENNRMVERYEYDHNDSLIKTSYYGSDKNGDPIVEMWSKGNILTSTIKKTALLPNGDSLMYILFYEYVDDTLFEIMALPKNYSNMYKDRKTIRFNYENNELISYTYYNHSGDDIGTLQDHDEGQTYELNSNAEVHPMVSELKWVMNKSRPGTGSQ